MPLRHILANRKPWASASSICCIDSATQAGDFDAGTPKGGQERPLPVHALSGPCTQSPDSCIQLPKKVSRSAGCIAPASKLSGSSLASDSALHSYAPPTWMELGRGGSPES